MAYLGGSSSWQYYLTVDECLAQGPSLLDRRVRVNGSVAPASLRIDGDRASATFSMGGQKGTVSVVCEGPLPDNLAEDVAVVVEGRLEQPGLLRGE